MKTWNDYKEYVRTVDPETAKDIKETEEVAAIVTAMVEQRSKPTRTCCHVRSAAILCCKNRVLQNNA